MVGTGLNNKSNVYKQISSLYIVMAAEDAGRGCEPEHSSDVEISVIPVEEQPLPSVNIYKSVVGLALGFKRFEIIFLII